MPERDPKFINPRARFTYGSSTINNPATFEGSVDVAEILLKDYTQTTNALAKDFMVCYRNNELGTGLLKELALPYIERYSQAAKKDLTGHASNPMFLANLISKRLYDFSIDYYQNTFVEQTQHKDKTWQDFVVEHFPASLHINLQEIHDLNTKTETAFLDPEIRLAHQQEQQRQKEVRIHTGKWLNCLRLGQKAQQEADSIYKAASASERQLTPAEQRRIKQLGNLASTYLSPDENIKEIPLELHDGVKTEFKIAMRRIHKRRFEKYGIVITPTLKEIIEDVTPALDNNQPVLFVGETGGAKTALAEYIARTRKEVKLKDRIRSPEGFHKFSGRSSLDVLHPEEPAFEQVAGNDEVNSYQLVGQATLQQENGVTVSEFIPGPLLKAIEEGRILIINEINAMPTSFLKRLNEVLQLKPGQDFVVQEDGGRRVKVKQGFGVIATANEKSRRYRGVENLSADLLNRFGANVIRVNYPDHKETYDSIPRENVAIAEAVLADKNGEIPDFVDTEAALKFIRAAFMSQQIFSGKYGLGESTSQIEQQIDSPQDLQEAVFSPRIMVAILQKYANSMGRRELKYFVSQFVEGIKNPDDKKQILTILEGQKFDISEV